MTGKSRLWCTHGLYYDVRQEDLPDCCRREARDARENFECRSCGATWRDTTPETKPPGYSIHISGSGLSMVLKLDGRWIDSEPHCGNPNRARQYLARRAWKHYREMMRLREEALRA